MAARGPADVPIRDESIRLGQFMKLADLVAYGSDARDALIAGEVLVNGEPESRRGRRLRPGDVVEFAGRSARVAGPAISLPAVTSLRGHAVSARGTDASGHSPGNGRNTLTAALTRHESRRRA
jgi:ribosome-associated protein